MLHDYLFGDYRPIAKAENVLLFHDYRISILKSRILRIEKGKTMDYPTKAFWYRDLEVVKFTPTYFDNGVMIQTKDVVVYIDDDFTKSYALLNEKKVPLTNEGNLLSTTEGLDGCDGNVDTIYAKTPTTRYLENGVCSKTGVAIIDDGDTEYIDENGMFIKDEEPRFDKYVFIYGHNYQDAVIDFYELSGKAPIIPRYALGNWWSRYYPYSDEEYLELMDKFEEHNVPLTVATIDMDWHPSTKVVEYYHLDTLDRMKLEYFNPDEEKWKWGWTGYSWERNLFKNPKKFLKNLHSRGLKTVLNMHPEGVRWYETQYPPFAKAMGIDPKTLAPVKMNFNDPSFVNGYFDYMHHPLEEDGVDFWWVDDLHKAMSINHFYYQDNHHRYGMNGLTLARFEGTGSQRYPLGFSGDSVMSWKSLNYVPYFTATATNIGYTWWSHDIGAFMYGYKDNELFVRYVQFGLFSPILRLHCQANPTLTKEPWSYSNGAGEIVAKYLRLRHKMIPYLYSGSYRNTKEGLGLIEPLYYYDSEDERAYKYKNEYMFNGQLLVAPITAKSTSQGMSAMKVYLPKGKWTDIFTGEIYTGNKEITMVRYLDSIPVLAKEGAFFILSDEENTNSIANPKKLEVQVFNGTGSFTLYEDNDGLNESHTFFESDYRKGVQYLSIFFDNNGAIPENRTLRIVFKNIKKGVVYGNDNFKVKYRDNIEVIISNIDTKKMYEIQVVEEKESKLDMLKRIAINDVISFEGDNVVRNTLFDKITSCASVSEFVKIVNEAKIPKIYKQKLKECR